MLKTASNYSKLSTNRVYLFYLLSPEKKKLFKWKNVYTGKTKYIYIFLFFNLITLSHFLFHALNKTPFRKTGCLINPYLFTSCWRIQIFDSPSFLNTVNQATLGNQQQTYAGSVWLTRHHVTALVNRYFLPNPNLEKQRVSLRVTSILCMRVCLHK